MVKWKLIALASVTLSNLLSVAAPNGARPPEPVRPAELEPRRPHLRSGESKAGGAVRLRDIGAQLGSRKSSPQKSPGQLKWAARQAESLKHNPNCSVECQSLLAKYVEMLNDGAVNAEIKTEIYKDILEIWRAELTAGSAFTFDAIKTPDQINNLLHACARTGEACYAAVKGKAEDVIGVLKEEPAFLLPETLEAALANPAYRDQLATGLTSILTFVKQKKSFFKVLANLDGQNVLNNVYAKKFADSLQITLLSSAKSRQEKVNTLMNQINKTFSQIETATVRLISLRLEREKLIAENASKEVLAANEAATLAAQQVLGSKFPEYYQSKLYLETLAKNRAEADAILAKPKDQQSAEDLMRAENTYIAIEILENVASSMKGRLRLGDDSAAIMADVAKLLEAESMRNLFEQMPAALNAAVRAIAFKNVRSTMMAIVKSRKTYDIILKLIPEVKVANGTYKPPLIVPILQKIRDNIVLIENLERILNTLPKALDNISHLKNDPSARRDFTLEFTKAAKEGNLDEFLSTFVQYKEFAPIVELLKTELVQVAAGSGKGAEIAREAQRIGERLTTLQEQMPSKELIQIGEKIALKLGWVDNATIASSLGALSLVVYAYIDDLMVSSIDLFPENVQGYLLRIVDLIRDNTQAAEAIRMMKAAEAAGIESSEGLGIDSK